MLHAIAQKKPRPRSGEVISCKIPTKTVSFLYSEERKAEIIVPKPGANTLMARITSAALWLSPRGMPLYTWSGIFIVECEVEEEKGRGAVG